MWGNTSAYLTDRIFRIQKRAIRTIAGLRKADSCRETFTDLQILTLPCLYILEVILYARFSCPIITGADVHEHHTRGRSELRSGQQRLNVAQALPHNAGARFFNKLPGDMKNINDKNKFKIVLRAHLLNKAFYSIEEFLTD